MARSSNKMFTDTMIKKLKPGATKYIRSEGNGFTIRVMPSGVKTWLYLYRFDGKRREMNMGSYPDVDLATARSKFEDAKKQVKNGIDPLAEKEEKTEARSKAPTISDLVEEFIEKWVKKKKTAKAAYNDERTLRKDMLPKWGKLKAASIRRRDAILLLEEVAARAPGQAQCLARCCRKMFSFGVQREIVEINPFTEMVATIPELAPRKRDRVLTADEIKIVWHAIDTGPGSELSKKIIKLILVTGQRPGEVCGMRRSEIEGNWWSVSADRMKRRKLHRVYLTPLALSMVPEGEGDIVFPSPKMGASNTIKPISVCVLTDIFKRAKHYNIPHFTAHDLRRTCRTFMAEIGVPREHAEAVLSHSLQGVEGVYNRYHYDKEKQIALESWSRKLQSIVDRTENNVVSIQAGRRAG